jgi:hypothetical protein
MSTPTEYQILRERHDRLREGIAALARTWEMCASDATKRGMPAPWDGLTFAQEHHAAKLRVLLDQEDA